MPGSPALVDALAGAHEPSRRVLGAIGTAVGQAVDALGASGARETAATIDIVCPRNQQHYTAHTGSFAAWGAPQVSVGEGNYLPELVARYALAQPSLAGRSTRVREVRSHVGAPDPGVLTIVVADGSAGLTERAPLALMQGAPELHRTMERFADGEDVALPENLEELGVLEPELWFELARLNRVSSQLVDSDASLGVGRYVALWEVA